MGITMRPLIRPGHHRILRRTRRPSRDRCFVAPSSHGHDLHLLTRNAAEDYTLLFPEPVPALAHFPAPRVPVVPPLQTIAAVGTPPRESSTFPWPPQNPKRCPAPGKRNSERHSC